MTYDVDVVSPEKIEEVAAASADTNNAVEKWLADNPAKPEQSGIAPVNAFVAALAEQVFQRVAKLVDERINTMLSLAPEAPEFKFDDAVENKINEMIGEALNDYDPTQHGDFDYAVERIVEGQLDDIDFDDKVSDALSGMDLEDRLDLDSLTEKVINNSEFEAGVKGVVEAMTFEVSVS